MNTIVLSLTDCLNSVPVTGNQTRTNRGSCSYFRFAPERSSGTGHVVPGTGHVVPGTGTPFRQLLSKLWNTNGRIRGRLKLPNVVSKCGSISSKSSLNRIYFKIKAVLSIALAF